MQENFTVEGHNFSVKGVLSYKTEADFIAWGMTAGLYPHYKDERKKTALGIVWANAVKNAPAEEKPVTKSGK